MPDPVGLGQTAALSAKTGAYYFVAIPIGAESILPFPVVTISLM